MAVSKKIGKQGKGKELLKFRKNNPSQENATCKRFSSLFDYAALYKVAETSFNPNRENVTNYVDY